MLSTDVLIGIALVALVVMSAFFSGSETSMMAVNRYRLRHQAKHGKKSAVRVSRLLERPDRLLGVILIGNTFANILAASLATTLAIRWWGDAGIAVATISLTLIVLVFAEVAPKTLAALHSQKLAFIVSLPLVICLKVLYPLVWLVNTIVGGMLRVIGVHVKRKDGHEHLSHDELKTLLTDLGSKISTVYQDMLLRILDMKESTVEDVLIPRNEIYGIDLNTDVDVIIQFISQSEHAYIPVYDSEIDKLKGVLSLRRILPSLSQGSLDKESLLSSLYSPYFIPESTPLTKQMLNFREHERRVGFVVDEYGDITGMVTLSDIIEEIVGSFSEEISDEVLYQSDGSYLIAGGVNLRELNRELSWDLPASGPKTISGMIVEHLETIPVAGQVLSHGRFQLTVVEVEDNAITWVKIRVLQEDLKEEKH